MDILKELFGTSDELQISKSLFGGDGGAGSEELVLGEPADSRSRLLLHLCLYRQVKSVPRLNGFRCALFLPANKPCSLAICPYMYM